MQRTIACLAFLCLLLGIAAVSTAKSGVDDSVKLIAEARLEDPRSSNSPFRLHAKITLHQVGQISTNGPYLFQWVSRTNWREEISTPDFSQIRLGAEGGVWEVRNPAYLSLPMWQLMQALTF